MKKVDLPKYPYNCVGLVVSYFKENPNPIVGTGFLIGARYVLTASHNCYDKAILKYPAAEKIYFIADPHGKDIEDGRITAIVNRPASYIEAPFSNDKLLRKSDYALLVLEEEVERDKYLRIVPS